MTNIETSNNKRNLYYANFHGNSSVVLLHYSNQRQDNFIFILEHYLLGVSPDGHFCIDNLNYAVTLYNSCIIW